jgi:hypothetical protein
MNAKRLVGAWVVAADLAISTVTGGLGTAAADHGSGSHPGVSPGGWDRGPGGPGGHGADGVSPRDHNPDWGPSSQT